jgi:hypothetical protein
MVSKGSGYCPEDYIGDREDSSFPIQRGVEFLCPEGCSEGHVDGSLHPGSSSYREVSWFGLSLPAVQSFHLEGYNEDP